MCAGLRMVFEHVGAVPSELVFDNAAGVGHRRGTTVEVTGLFAAFLAHYRTSVSFCNPYSGNEKGSVENAVGFVRRNLMVPLPHARSLEGLSRAWLEQCDQIAQRTHYRKGVAIEDLFAAGRAAMLALPGIGFDACSWYERRVDKVGNIQIDTVRYLAGAHLAGQVVQVGVRAASVEILDQDGRRVAMLERVYGPHATTVHDPAVLLPVLNAKPHAWEQSVLRADTPTPIRDLLDQAPDRERRRLLGVPTSTGGRPRSRPPPT